MGRFRKEFYSGPAHGIAKIRIPNSELRKRKCPRHRSPVFFILNSGSSGYRVGRLQVEPSAVEEDGDLEVVEIAVSACQTFDRFDPAVEALAPSLGDGAAEVVQKRGKVTGELIGSLHDRHQARVGSPEKPRLPESNRPRLGVPLPEAA